MRRLGLLISELLLALCLAPLALAGDLYKWQDEEGVWHFSDKPPKSKQQVFESMALPAEPSPMVTMRKAGSRQEPVHLFINHYLGPAELEIRLNIADNIRSQPPMPARIVLPPHEEIQAVQFFADNPKEGFRYQLAYTLVPGPPLEDLPPDLDFYPPFPARMDFPISQGFDTGTTHKDAANRYAVDIVMPEGTPVLAARDGLVMEVEDDFHGGEQQQRYLDRANRVRLLHDDGSMAVYAHLEANSARVRPGARVPAGTWIANSGNTGFSSGPHLHFVVQVNAGLSLESVPFRFRLPGGGAMTPESPEIVSGVFADH
jgi:murein DD-endopeptidase MepM/ murein hydrolase activator NlpD